MLRFRPTLRQTLLVLSGIALIVWVSKKRAIMADPELITANPGATSSQLDNAWAVERLGGKPVDPRGYPETVEGFQSFLDAVGVNRQWSSAVELTRPNHPNIAATFGYTIFLPKREKWLKGAALALAQNRLRELVGTPIRINNWWRPAGYNEAVGGKTKGDHPDADALDLNFSSAADQKKAHDWVLANWYTAEPRLAISLGDYPSSRTVMHIGIQSRNGRRKWSNAPGGVQIA
jgi:hypothetical protein